MMWVYCSKCERDRAGTSVVVTDTERDPHDRHIVTFTCSCGATLRKSLVFSK